MANTILAKHLLKLSKFLLSLLLISFIMSPAYANSGSVDGTDTAKDMVIRHMEIMRQKFPDIDEKVRETEEKLRSGSMSPMDACSDCHIRGSSNPTAR